MSTNDEPQMAELRECPLCDKPRASSAEVCVHCGDIARKKQSALDRLERYTKVAAVLAIPILTALIGHLQYQQSHEFAEARSASEDYFKQLAADQAKLDQKKLDEERRKNQKWLELERIAKDQALKSNHALELLEHLSGEKENAEIAVLMALCFASSDQLHANVIPVLVHRTDVDRSFFEVFSQTLDELERDAHERGNQKLIRQLEIARNRLQTREAVRNAKNLEEKKRIARDALDNSAGRGHHSAFASATAILDDADLRGVSDIRSTATEVIEATIERAEGEDEEAVVEVVKEALAISKSDALSREEADRVRAQAEQLSWDKIPRARRVEIQEQTFGSKERFVIVYSEDRDREAVAKLNAWAQESGMNVVVVNTNNLSKAVERPAEIELRFCRDNAGARARADALLEDLGDLLNKALRNPKGLPKALISQNEYEVWFPE